MKIGGVSVMGSYHEKNQDYFLASSFDFGDLICVSDGVGSCRYSEIGSRNACFSLRTMIEKNKGIPSADNELNKFIESFHSEWVKNVTSELPEGATVDDCCATLLFCFCAEGNAIAGRLGDGFVGIKMSNGNDILFDRKEGRLENETYSLYEHYEPSEWQKVEIPDAE